jgi:capsid portal protein
VRKPLASNYADKMTKNTVGENFKIIITKIFLHFCQIINSNTLWYNEFGEKHSGLSFLIINNSQVLKPGNAVFEC